MADLLNGSVMLGLVSASSSSSLQQVATNEYYKARNKGDLGAMERCRGYATDARDKAMDAVDETKEALAERIKEVNEEERLEKEQAEKAALAEAPQSVENATSTTQADNHTQSSIPSEQPAATLELSQEYLDSVQAETISAAEPNTSIETDDAVITPTKKMGQAPAYEAKIYTKTGKPVGMPSTRIKLH